MSGEKRRSPRRGKQQDATFVEPPPVKARGRLGRFLLIVAKLFLPAIMIGLGVYTFVWLKDSKPEVRQRAATEKVWAINSVELKSSTYQPRLRLYGETRAGRRVELRALVAGEVIEVGSALREGGIVGKDEKLLTIDPFQYKGELDEARAKLKAARAKLTEIKANIALEQDALKRVREQLVIAHRDLERAIPLSRKGTVSQKFTDDRRMIVSQREQSVEQHINNIKIQKARADQQIATIAQLDWGVRRATRKLSDTVLTAPFNAYVGSVDADIGRLVNVNDRIAILYDRNWIEVRFILSDTQYGRILEADGTVIGRKVIVRWNVGRKPLEFDATIMRLGAQIASASGGVEAYARLAHAPAASKLRAGTFVEILVPDRPYLNVARLPQTALYGGNRIYVIEKGRLRGRQVELVGTAGSDILVRGSFAKGEKAMVTRLSTAGDGLRVREQ